MNPKAQIQRQGHKIAFHTQGPKIMKIHEHWNIKSNLLPIKSKGTRRKCWSDKWHGICVDGKFTNSGTITQVRAHGENPQIHRENTQTQNTERPQLATRFKLRTFLLWGHSNCCNTVLPVYSCCFVFFYVFLKKQITLHKLNINFSWQACEKIHSLCSNLVEDSS